MYYPVLAAGILSFPRVTRSRTERLQFAIDTASVVCGGGMLLIYILAGPGARALPSRRRSAWRTRPAIWCC
jgi:hypothetical protein